MTFMKGVAAGMIAGAIAGAVLMPKPKRFGARMKKTANKAARSVGEMVDNIISSF